eukprot:3652601-Prymnesium_polylepis.1
MCIRDSKHGCAQRSLSSTLGRRRHGACAIQHGYASCGLRFSGFPSKVMALSRLRAILSAQSDGKTESSWIQQVLAASLRKQDRAHRTWPARNTHAGSPGLGLGVDFLPRPWRFL